LPFLAPSGKMETVCLMHDQTESIWRRRPLMTRGILAEGHRETIKSGLRLHPTIASRSKAGLHWRERSHLAVPATDLHINTNPLNSHFHHLLNPSSPTEMHPHHSIFTPLATY